MTKAQIEKKAKEIANKYAALGFKSGFSNERYEAAMEMAEWVLSHQWISVEDELPPESKNSNLSERVIVRTKSQYIESSIYDFLRNKWERELSFDNITHWMPIPPMAEEGGEK